MTRARIASRPADSPGSSAASSYRFHERLESPREFIRREWRWILLFGGGFTAVLIAIVTMIDQSFFYPRLQTDALLYYLKAKAVADSGTTAASLAVNLPPFPYASMPGALRAPLLKVFSEFDDQIRAIQMANILIVDVIGLIAAYILSWALPQRRHWMAVGFSFGFILLAPWWLANVFMPMADAPYAAFSLLSMVIAIRAITSPAPLLRPWPLILLTAVFIVAFLLRYTEPVVLVLIAFLIRGKYQGASFKWKNALIAIGAALFVIAFLVFLNREAIIGRYLAEPVGLIARGDKQSIILNFFFLAVPEQIVPGFVLGFAHHPVIDLYHAQFAASRWDGLWSAAGGLITAIVLLGAWRVRGRMLPELMMIITVLPLLIAMMPSTSRYLMTYQPFFWIAFLEGSRGVVEWIPAGARQLLVSRARVLATAGCFVVLAVGLQASRAPGLLLSKQSRIVELMNLPRHVHGVSDTYRPLRRFLESLPADRTLLTSSRLSMGRWKAIANLDSYAPDSNMVAIAAQKDVYMIVECGAVDLCALQDARESVLKDALCSFGEFNYELVFSAKGEKSEARVFRIRPAT
ncbi:MAG TPA: hypothetical protein VM053_04620 [Gemmatimonadaceae bacterium]|nr:hypothetical protein [Gemmatimonadaceae bacterium]